MGVVAKAHNSSNVCPLSQKIAINLAHLGERLTVNSSVNPSIIIKFNHYRLLKIFFFFWIIDSTHFWF